MTEEKLNTHGTTAERSAVVCIQSAFEKSIPFTWTAQRERFDYASFVHSYEWIAEEILGIILIVMLNPTFT